MEKLSLTSTILYDHSILQQSKQLYTYRLQTIHMSSKQFHINLPLLIKQIKMTTYEYIIHTEFLCSFLHADTEYKNTHIFNSEYYDCLKCAFRSFISNKDIHLKLLTTWTTILFNTLRSSSISFVHIWHLITNDDSFYNILEKYLNHVIDIQIKAIVDRYIMIT